jgi:hypothetical protein
MVFCGILKFRFAAIDFSEKENGTSKYQMQL